ncbi:MAG: membrane protein of unknown function [Promethearchaeota archaeon]|nr:MAG: membrane protein of unknown function [Candidatus Lokiarchaeota archaeon]
MNQIIIFSLIILILLRTINTAVASDFYKKTKDFKYLVLGVGWFLWELSAIIPLFLLQLEEPFLIDIIIFHDAFLAVMAMLFLCWALILFIIDISKRIILYVALTIVSINYLILFLFGFSIVIQFSSLVTNIIWISSISYLLLKWKQIREISNKTKKWFLLSIAIISYAYLPIGIYICFKGYGFGLYFINDIPIIIINYGYLLVITVLLTIFTIYLEFRLLNTHKNELKDKYSHDLGNTLQGIFTAIEILEHQINESGKYDETEKVKELKKLLITKRKEAADLLNEIREL